MGYFFYPTSSDQQVEYVNCSTHANMSNSQSTATEIPEWLGFVLCFIAVICYAINYFPVKKIPTGDGLIFQWIMCAAIFMVGYFVECIRGSGMVHVKPFFPLVSITGALWCTGNLMVVPIIETIGLSTGLLVWSAVNLLGGWASGRFGLLVCPQVPSNETLNYIGVALCCAAAIGYGFIEPSLDVEPPKSDDTLANNSSVVVNPPEQTFDSTADVVPLIVTKSVTSGLWSKWPLVYQRMFGLVLSVVSGLCYSQVFSLSTHVQDHWVIDGKEVSQNGLDYAFEIYCGVFFASTIYTIIYCFVVKNRPYIHENIVLPSLLSGFLWTGGTTSWLLANSVLQESITFPIISSCPGSIAALFGIFYFKEIRGYKNYSILTVAICLTVCGSIFVGLSK